MKVKRIAYRVSRIASKLIRASKLTAWVCLTVGLSSCGVSDGEATEGGPEVGLEVDELGSALVQNQTLTISLPALVNVNHLALGARDTLTLGDRTQVFNTIAASTCSGQGLTI